MSKSTTRGIIYKGKVTHRSWPQLPEELVRHIATFYLWDLSATGYCPQTWDTREHWYQRMVFTTLRDANELEKHMMDICPQWHLALQQHLFWQKAVTLIDPNDVLAHYAIVHPKSISLNTSSAPLQPHRLSPYRHFRNITGCSCLVCRINAPGANTGLTSAKSQIYTPYLVKVGLCRDHSRRPASFCGLCLRDAPVFESVTGGADVAAHLNMIAVIENEDKESFPNVEATCRCCRGEWLWRRVCDSPRDREAIGGRTMCSDDWETRTSVDSFIDLAEGSIKDVIILAKEKYWLRMNTRLTDMLDQALAASRYNSGRSYQRDEQEEEEEEDEDEDFELMQMEENGVRELALGDWARSRIMDGHWFSPADIWYNHALPGKSMLVRAVHPCPWSRDASTAGSSPSVLGEGEEEEAHPRQSTVNGEIPPTFGLCEQAFLAHQRQLRTVLIPPMRNLVRKIVIECATPGLGSKVEDPAIRAARMTLEDVLTELREDEGVWFDGFDWVERSMNDRRERERRERDSCDDSSTASSGSRSSTDTSPVLSTSTLQTTPSPSPVPVGDENKEEDVPSRPTSFARPVSIAIPPVLDPPKLLTAIPHIPVTVSHFPQFTMEALKMVWREACLPLYHCRCRICQRASTKANSTNDNPQGQAAPVIVVPSSTPTQPQAPLPAKPDATVIIEGAHDVDGEGEEEISLLQEEEDDDDMEEVDDVDEYDEEGSEEEAEGWYTPSTTPHTVAPGPNTHALPFPVVPRARKRSCDEVEHEPVEQGGKLSGNVDWKSRPLNGIVTPPKRARRDELDVAENFRNPDRVVLKPSLQVEKPSIPRRMRKRSSEEVEDAGDEGVNKRIKISSPTSTSPSVRVPDEERAESPPSSTTDMSRPSSASLPS